MARHMVQTHHRPIASRVGSHSSALILTLRPLLSKPFCKRPPGYHHCRRCRSFEKPTSSARHLDKQKRNQYPSLRNLTRRCGPCNCKTRCARHALSAESPSGDTTLWKLLSRPHIWRSSPSCLSTKAEPLARCLSGRRKSYNPGRGRR